MNFLVLLIIKIISTGTVDEHFQKCFADYQKKFKNTKESNHFVENFLKFHYGGEEIKNDLKSLREGTELYIDFDVKDEIVPNFEELFEYNNHHNAFNNIPYCFFNNITPTFESSIIENNYYLYNNNESQELEKKIFNFFLSNENKAVNEKIEFNNLFAQDYDYKTVENQIFINKKSSDNNFLSQFSNRLYLRANKEIERIYLQALNSPNPHTYKESNKLKTDSSLINKIICKGSNKLGLLKDTSKLKNRYYSANGGIVDYKIYMNKHLKNCNKFEISSDANTDINLINAESIFILNRYWFIIFNDSENDILINSRASRIFLKDINNNLNHCCLVLYDENINFEQFTHYKLNFYSDLNTKILIESFCNHFEKILKSKPEENNEKLDNENSFTVCFSLSFIKRVDCFKILTEKISSKYKIMGDIKETTKEIRNILARIFKLDLKYNGSELNYFSHFFSFGKGLYISSKHANWVYDRFCLIEIKELISIF